MSLGKKYTCFKCNTKFYDLNKPEPVCPKCGVDQRTNPNPDSGEGVVTKYKRPSAAESRSAKRAPAGEDEEEEEFDEDFLDEAEPGLDEEEEDFGDLDEDTEEAEEEDYD